MKVLVFNAGSSSLKFKLFDCVAGPGTTADEAGRGAVLCRGQVAGMGLDESRLECTNSMGSMSRELAGHTYGDAMDAALACLTDVEGAPLASLDEVEAVGHRVAHAGDAFSCSVPVDDDVMAVIDRYSELAPLHNPYALQVMRRCQKTFPDALEVAAFDTAFHQTMPRRSYIYPIPYRYYEKYGIRRFGFHGISHKYVSRKAAEFLGEDLRSLKMITCHLGAGASICAIDHGYSMDTSMGYTPLDGVMMNTRSGSVDPAIITAIMDKEGLTPHQMDEVLNRQSGFLGVSGTSSDLRDLKEVIRYGDTQAELAYDIFLFSIRRMIGAYAFELAGVDAIVCTAGVGENDPYARRLIFRGLEPFGIEVDEARNQADSHEARLISTDRSSVRMLVVPTDEEAEIARDVALIASGIDISDPWAYEQ